MRPIACESEDIILMAPISCKMSSAAIVSARIRDSAKATSSLISLSRWWQTICRIYLGHLENQLISVWWHSNHKALLVIVISYKHVEVLIYSIDSERTGWVSWRGENIFYSTNFDNIWSMTTTRAFTGNKRCAQTNLVKANFNALKQMQDLFTCDKYE